MNIVYADDDQLSLEIVLRALQARGHQVTTLNSSQPAQMLGQFRQVLEHGPVPQLVILDGHNIAKDLEGQPIVDVQPTMLRGWFLGSGLPEGTRFVLYSSDDHLLSQAREAKEWGFWAAVAKTGTGGGLNALLRAIEDSQS